MACSLVVACSIHASSLEIVELVAVTYLAAFMRNYYVLACSLVVACSIRASLEIVELVAAVPP